VTTTPSDHRYGIYIIDDTEGDYGDWAEADSLEGAMTAAQTLWDEACAANPVQGYAKKLECRVYVDGDLLKHWHGERPRLEATS